MADGPNYILIGGIVIGLIAVGLIVYFMFFRNKKEEDDEYSPPQDPSGPTFSAPTSGGGGGGAGGYTLVGDLAANSKERCIGAFGLRYLIPEYDGPVVRVQTSASASDTAKDFKPSGDGGLVSMDGQSLQDYLGASAIGRVEKLFDQSIDFKNENKPRRRNDASSNGSSLPEIRPNKFVNLQGQEEQKGWVITFRQGNELQSRMTFPRDLDIVSMYMRARLESGSSGRVVRVGNNVGISLEGGKWAANFGAASFSTSTPASKVHKDGAGKFSRTDPLDTVILRARKWPVNSGTTNVTLHVNKNGPDSKSKDVTVPKEGSVVIGGDGGVNTQISEVLFFEAHLQEADVSTMTSGL